MNIETTILQQ